MMTVGLWLKTNEFIKGGYSNMKAIFETDDPMEIKRLIKANDMASFIWELVHNGWRDFKHTDYDYEKSWGKIHELLQEYNIDIDNLIE